MSVFILIPGLRFRQLSRKGYGGLIAQSLIFIPYRGVFIRYGYKYWQWFWKL